MENDLRKAGARTIECVASLFNGWEDTLIYSALEGCMGHVWIVADPPRAALVECADFLFLAGDGGSDEPCRLLESWRAWHDESFRILAARGETLNVLIERVFGKDAVRTKRCAFHKGGENFDPIRLNGLISALPKEIELRPFDRELYHRALKEKWSRDFCLQFRDAEDFLARGLGVAALRGGELVGGAASYTRYSRGIEIQVETRKDMYRRGIAAACCSKLILMCMERNLYPSWDAATPASAALARKLGYVEAGTYTAWKLGDEMVRDSSEKDNSLSMDKCGRI